MTCPSCQTENRAGVAFCASCGARLVVGVARDRSGLAGVALALGIVGFALVWVAGIGVGVGLALVGLAVGGATLVMVKRDPLGSGGAQLALASVIVSGGVVALTPAWISLLRPMQLERQIAKNEAAVVADVRSVMEAEKGYSYVNHDFYDTLDCVARPGTCIPDYPASAPASFLDGELASSSVKDGYRRELRLRGPAVETSGKPISPSSATGFAYVAAPIKPGETGRRAFCGDDLGIVRVADGHVPLVDGRCPDSLPALE